MSSRRNQVQVLVEHLFFGFSQERYETFQRLGVYHVHNLVWGLLGLVSLDLIPSSIRSSRTFGILGALGLIHCCFRLTLHAASVGVGANGVELRCLGFLFMGQLCFFAWARFFQSRVLSVPLFYFSWLLTSGSIFDLELASLQNEPL